MTALVMHLLFEFINDYRYLPQNVALKAIPKMALLYVWEGW